MNEYFEGKTAIVTGAASGIGRAVAAALAARGTTVMAADLNGEGAAQVTADIAAAGGRAESVALDVTRENDVRALVERTVSTRGRLDFMFNNAGIGIGGDERDITGEQWRRVVDVDLWGVIYGTRAAYAVMVRQGSGHIVNTASLAGLVAGPMQASYTTSKHAVVGLSRALRIEGADLGVRVSVVCPGVIDTPILHTSPIMGGVNINDLLASSPLRAATPANLANAILNGVARNRAVIIHPFHAQALRWLDVLLPSLSQAIWRKFGRDFRRLRERGARKD